jgi:hypothetical protein
MAVGAPGVFLADQGTGSLLRLALEGGVPTPIVTRKFLIAALHVLKSRIFYGEEQYWIWWQGVTDSVDALGKDHVKLPAHGDCWAMASDGERLFDFGREADPSGIPKLSVLGQDGKRKYGNRLTQIQITAAAADEQCLYYTRTDPADVTWYSAMPKPEVL